MLSCYDNTVSRKPQYYSTVNINFPLETFLGVFHYTLIMSVKPCNTTQWCCIGWNVLLSTRNSIIWVCVCPCRANTLPSIPPCSRNPSEWPTADD